MATLRRRWLLAILLVNLSSCPSTDASAHPSHLECYFPCTEERCSVHIHCSWKPVLDAQTPMNYSLHWKPAASTQGYVTSETGYCGIINRENFSNNRKLHVWVEATSQNDSFTSPKAVFNTADIIKPPHPNVTLKEDTSMELEWASFCVELGFSVGNCDVRYRFDDQVWLEHEVGLFHRYTIESPQPCTVYEFQVRCVCKIGLTSDWSPIHTIRNTEMMPIGKPDIWWDCGTSPANFNCALTWKNLAMSQLCSVLGYEVKLFYSNSTIVHARELSGLLCNEMQCHFNTSLKDVTSFNVSAFNSHGATEPSQLIMPVTGKKKDEKGIRLEINEVNLTVSWDLLPQHADNLKEYVVQYKQAGSPLGKGFDWIKVMKDQTTVIFQGQFKKQTAFVVSLFSVSRSLEIHHRSSAVGYSLEGIPPAVESFEVLAISDTQVTLFWKPILLSEQKGVIQYYQIGVQDTKDVYNVSASTQHENGTFELKHLNPGQEHVVWIRAVTAAGPGANTTRRVKTTYEIYVHLIPAVLGPIIFVIISSLVFFYCCHGENKVMTWFCEKVPDPSNSHIFGQMKHQLDDSWTYISVNEPPPNISLLEIVEIQPQEFISSPDGLTKPVQVGRSHMDCQDDQREDVVTKQGGRAGLRYGRKEYSKMVDSDEEREIEENGDDCWNSSEDDHFTSDYEKHFMPTVFDIFKV